MEENNQEQMGVNQNLNEEQKFTPLGQVNEPMPKKKKSKLGILIAGIVLLLAIIGGVIFYYLQVYTNPKTIYQQIVKTGINTLMSTEELPKDISTVKAKVKADVDVKLDDAYLEDGMEEILDIINEIEATLEVQMDLNEEKMFLGVDSNYEGEKLLNIQGLIDAKNEEQYIKFEPMFEDVLNMETVETDYEGLQESFKEMKKALEELKEESDTIFADANARKKATKILSEECAKIVKNEYVSKEKEKITINGKEKQADKYVLKMTYKQLMDEYISLFKSLKDNEELLNCYKNKDELKETIEALIEQVESIENEELEMTIAINLYRIGLTQEFARVDFVAESQGEEIAIKIEKQDETFAYKATAMGQDVFSGTVKIEEKDKETTKLALTLNIEEVVDFAMNMEVSGAINGEFKAFDTKNAKKLEDFSDDEKEEVLENLEESKLYELAEEISDITGEDIIGDSFGQSEDEDEDEEEKEDDQDDENELQLPAEEETPDQERPNEETQGEENSNSKGVVSKNGNLIVLAKNNNNVAVDMDFEVEFYDENGVFVGSSTDYLVAVGAGREVAVEMKNTPKNFATYKIYIDEEASEENEYFEQIEVTHNNNGQNIVVQVKNKSEKEIENITVVALYYNKGEIVGIEEDMVFDVASGRSGNFNLYYPYDQEYKDVQFDDYKIIVTEAFSYN